MKLSAIQASVLSIGEHQLANRAFLAPMSGVTDLPFRRLAIRFGAGLVMSEMVASGELLHDKPEARLRAEGEGIPLHVVQIAGREAGPMGEAARMAEASGAAIIDINMGCPSKRVTTGLSGSALMRDVDLACALIEAVTEAVSVPVTLKMRLGWDEHNLNAPVLARKAEDLGVRLVTVHGRTRNQFYKGKANWKAIRAVREATGLPVVANGDLMRPKDAPRMLEESGADAVMVGRGAYGRPWLPGQVGAYLETGTVPEAPSGADLRDLVREHYEAIVGYYGAPDGRPVGVRAARKHLGWYVDLLGEIGPEAARLRAGMMTSDSPDEVMGLIERLFEETGWKAAA